MNSLPPVSGLVLAGGQSSRMGEDKAALEIDGVSLLERAVALLSAELEVVYVSVRSGQAVDELRARYPLIEDTLADRGPAAGILSAHEHDPSSAWLVIACDMPLLDREMLRSLLAKRAPEAAATAWQAADKSGPEPLCALYEPATLAAFRQHVDTGANPSPRAWLASQNIHLLEADRPDRLAGANTKQEFDRITEYMKFGR